jgi:hypothetical protein
MMNRNHAGEFCTPARLAPMQDIATAWLTSHARDVVPIER